MFGLALPGVLMGGAVLAFLFGAAGVRRTELYGAGLLFMLVAVVLVLSTTGVRASLDYVALLLLPAGVATLLAGRLEREPLGGDGGPARLPVRGRQAKRQSRSQVR